MKIKNLLTHRNAIALYLQLAVYCFLVFTWSGVVYWTEKSADAALLSMQLTATIFALLLLVFMANYFFLVPKFYEKKTLWRKFVFWTLNLGMILMLNSPIFFFPLKNHEQIPAWRAGFYQVCILWLVINYMMVFSAMAVRYFQRQNDLKKQLIEEKQRNAEAELAWLKNQLNPHFLFNTLNNISSLVQIDADEAQDAIGQLSDLLRYALYGTQQKEVALGGEMEFMKNYISLMSLRCGANVDIKTDFEVTNLSRRIAPLIFLSPIENAFKHGVSSGKPSFVHILLKETAEGLLFQCANSNFPKNHRNQSGSGIGAENMHKRLELLYHGCYELRQKQDTDGYCVEILLKR